MKKSVNVSVARFLIVRKSFGIQMFNKRGIHKAENIVLIKVTIDTSPVLFVFRKNVYLMKQTINHNIWEADMCQVKSGICIEGISIKKVIVCIEMVMR